MTQLQSLQLMGSKVSDAGLQRLKGLTHSSDWTSTAPRVSDAGLNHLKGLTQLRELNLRGTKVTSAGVKGLRQALPECKIRH